VGQFSAAVSTPGGSILHCHNHAYLETAILISVSSQMKNTLYNQHL
jgi:hypothetical protein